MKLQNLAVIFIIIILPISILLTSYTSSHIQTLNMQISYDNKLNSSTYDALKAFQMNTLRSDTSDIANSKLSNIEASVNAFFTSVATNFNMQGYNKDVLKDYVPALVYTMYDGYYIYSPFTNKLTDKETGLEGATFDNGDKVTDLKPYIHYSCRYKKGNDDFVITYTLDNYIVIQGTINGNPVYDYGYLLNNVTINGSQIKYRDITIKTRETLTENVGNNTYEYIKINGVKYYKDGNQWFTMTNGQRINQSNTSFNQNKSGYYYYKEAYDFTNKVLNEYGLNTLKTSDAVDENGNKLYINQKWRRSHNIYR